MTPPTQDTVPTVAVVEDRERETSIRLESPHHSITTLERLGRSTVEALNE